MDYRNENLSDETKSKLCSIEDMFINMRASGLTVRQIARKLKKANQTISDLNKKYFRQVSELRNEKLEVLQKKMFEQKQERLDFLTEQLRIVNEAIKEKQIFLSYDKLVTLAIKITSALNKSERDMLVTDILNADFQADEPGSDREQDETSPSPGTNCPDEKPPNPDENNEVKEELKISGNAETKNKKLKTLKNKKSGRNKTMQNTGDTKIEEKNEENQNPQDDHPPRCKADFYRRVLKNKNAASASSKKDRSECSGFESESASKYIARNS